MKFSKKALALLLTFCCIFNMIVPALATDAQPFSLGTRDARATLSIGSDGRASCSVQVTAREFSQRIVVSATLQRVNANTHLPISDITTWTANSGDKNYLYDSSTHAVSKGYSYRIKCIVTVMDSNKNQIESFEVYSNVCP